MISNSFKTVFPYIVIMILICIVLFQKKQQEEYIVIPQQEGEFERQDPQPIIKYDTVVKNDTIVLHEVKEVNEDLLRKYEEAKDSIEQLNLFINAITIREYQEEYINDDITITVNSQVTGTLHNQKVSYKIPEKQIKKSNRGLFIGVGTSINYENFNLPSFNAHLSYLNNSNIFTLGINNQKHIILGISQKIF